MSATALRELLAVFGIEVEGGEKLDHVDKQLESLFGKVRRFGELAAEAFAIHEVKEFVEGQIAAGAQLKVMAERLGTTTDEMQAFDLAAGQAGVGAGAMETALRFLNRNLGEAISGSAEAAKTFAELKIQVKNADGTTRSAGDVMGELADRIAAIQDPAKATNFAMKLLGRGGAELVPILLKGGDAFRQAREQMQALGGGMSSEFVEHAHEAEAANVRLQFSLSGLKSQIALALFPVVEKIVTQLTKWTVAGVWLAKNSTLLKTGLEALAVVAGIKLAFSLSKLLGTLGLLKPSILETVAALGEFALPLAGIAAAYLLFDDFWTMMEGGKSIIGDDLDALFGLGTSTKVAEDLKQSWSEVGTTLRVVVGGAIEEVWGWLKSLGKAVSDFENGNFSGILGDVGGTGPTSDLGMENMLGENSAGGSPEAPSGQAPGVKSLLGLDVTPSPLGEQRMFEGGESPAADVPSDGTAAGATGAPPRTREPTSFAFMHGAPAHHPQTIHVPAAPRFDAGAGPDASAGGAGGAPVVIHQENHTEVAVHTSSDAPSDVGKAVGQGVSTSQQRANSNALASVKRP